MSDAPPPAGPPDAVTTPLPGRTIPLGGMATAATSAAPTGTAGTARGAPGAEGRGGGGRPPGPPPGRQAGRHSRWRTAFFVLAGVVILGLGLFALFGDKLLVVRSVSVSGTRLLTPEQVIGAADVPPGTSLFSVDTGAVTRRVEALNLVASATVSKEWPDILKVTVTERVAAMAVKMANGGYDLIDSDGVIVRYVKAKPAALPLLKSVLPGGALRGTPEVATAAAVLAELQPWLAKQVAQVSAPQVASGIDEVTLTLRDGKTVRWGGTDHAAQKNRELSILLPGHSRHVDVSSPATVAHPLTGRAPSRPQPEKSAAIVTERWRGGGENWHWHGQRQVFADVGRDTRQRAAWLVDRAAPPPYCPYQS